MTGWTWPGWIGTMGSMKKKPTKRKPATKPKAQKKNAA